MSHITATATATEVDSDHSSDLRLNLEKSEATLLGGRRLAYLPETAASASMSVEAIGANQFSDVGISADRFFSPLIKKPEFPRMDSAIVLEKWEGRVDEVSDNTFTATLTNLTNSKLDERAEFDLSEISKYDRSLAVPGAIFYWSVGYRDAISGQRTRESVLRFRRLPRWSSTTRREATELAATWKTRFHWGD
jgi:hypothetical protein